MGTLKNNKTDTSLYDIHKDYSSLLNSINDAVILMDGITFIDCNEKALELFGCKTKDELIDLKPYDLSPEFQPNGKLSKDSSLKRVYAASKGKPQFFEWKLTKFNNELMDTEVSLNLIQIGGYKRIIAIVRDITRRKKAEKINSVLFNISKATGESESLEKLLKIVQTEISKLMDARNFYVALILDKEKSIYHIPYGVDENPGEIDESGMVENLRGGITEYVFQKATPCLANKYQLEQLYKTNNIKLIGSDCESWMGVPLKSSSEGVIGILAVQSYNDPNAYTAKDIDVLLAISTTVASSIIQKRAINSLKESEKRFRKLSDAADEGILFYDEMEKIVDVNSALLEMIDYSLDELVGKKISKLFHDASYIALKKKGLSDSDIPIEIVLLTRNKSVIFCMSTVKNFDLGSGNVKVATFKDISSQKVHEKEKKILQEKLNRSEKMEALGRLAGGVAHDLNNILTSIVNYPDLILMNLKNEGKVKEYILKLKKSGQKAATIVEDLLTLARRGVTNFQPENMNTIIKDFFHSSEFEKIRTDYPKIKFVHNLQNDLLNIKGSRTHLTAMIMNLVLNSAEATKEEGVISISSKNSCDKNSNVTTGIKIEINDEGVGMTKEERNKIFEPFYTKKIKGRNGTGLGMSVVWGTVIDHRGLINVESTKGQGTTIELTFPPTSDRISLKEKLIPISEFVGKKERILLVDDESEPREIATEYLSLLNYKIESVSSGEKAISQFKKKKYDIVILDMLLGSGIDGLDTFIRLSKIDPSLKTIIVSGFSETERVKQAQKMGAGEYVKKPYSFRELGIAIKKELER